MQPINILKSQKKSFIDFFQNKNDFCAIYPGHKSEILGGKKNQKKVDTHY